MAIDRLESIQRKGIEILQISIYMYKYTYLEVSSIEFMIQHI